MPAEEKASLVGAKIVQPICGVLLGLKSSSNPVIFNASMSMEKSPKFSKFSNTDKFSLN